MLLPEIEWKPRPPQTEDEMFYNLDRIIAQADRAAERQERARRARLQPKSTSVKPRRGG